MLKLFVEECLFFQSDDALNKVLGVFGWISIGMLAYALLMVGIMVLQSWYS